MTSVLDRDLHWPLRLRIPAGVVGAALIAAGFAPFAVAYAPLVGIALLTLAWWRLPGKQACLTGLLFGLVFNLILLSWIQVLGVDAWLVLSLVMALWWILLGYASATASWVRAWPLLIPGVWLSVEFLRGTVPWGGFPWGRLAFAHYQSTLTPWAALGGEWLVGFLVAVVGMLLVVAAFALIRVPADVAPSPTRHLGVASLAIVAAGVVTCSGLLIPLPTQGQGDPNSATVAVVQGSVPRIGLDTGAQRLAVLRNHVAVTQDLAAEVAAGNQPQPVAVIWPENSVDVDPLTTAEVRTQLDAAADAIGVPILVGAVTGAPNNELFNIGIVWQPDIGPSEMYIKQHPVPFGEYLPGRQWLTQLVTRFERIPRDFAAGTETGVMQLGPITIGDVICFEVAYGQLVANTVRDGARLLVVQTNNATYARTSQPAQQVAMSQFRAVQHGRAVVVAATSGITAVMSPDGDIVAELPEQVSDYLLVQVPLRDSLTLSDRLGAWPEAAIVICSVFGWGIARYRCHQRLKLPK